jgi:hypothetical protein
VGRSRPRPPATYGFIRLQRTIWRRTQGFPHLWDDQQADLVVYRLGYHATGWITTGDALLANSADAARRHADTACDLADPDSDPLTPPDTYVSSMKEISWPWRASHGWMKLDRRVARRRRPRLA